MIAVAEIIVHHQGTGGVIAVVTAGVTSGELAPGLAPGVGDEAGVDICRSSKRRPFAGMAVLLLRWRCQ